MSAPARVRALLTTVACLGIATGVAAAADGGAGAPARGVAALACVAPTDASGIDAILTAAGSPMAGSGTDIVDAATAAGIDPRFIVAIAAHETMLETYVPAQAIHNPFGLGPGMSFDTEADAARYAAANLAQNYPPEGRTTIGSIGAKWHPWAPTTTRRRSTRTGPPARRRRTPPLGGDPQLQPLLADQATTPACGGGGSDLLSPVAPEPPSAGSGAPVVTLWGGNTPATHGATMTGFAFPLAVRGGGEVRYGAPTCTAGARCPVIITSAPGTDVVAASEGTLRAASPTDQAQGTAFWLVRRDGNRIGYGPLAEYAPGIMDGITVTVGQPLGRGTGTLTVVWARGGINVDPYPLLAATRPPDPAPAH
ncbi:MAG: hypothetical protein U0Y82_13865 [Thermoleophilia bacterium]